MGTSEPKKPRSLGSRETLLSARGEYAELGAWLKRYREARGIGQRSLSAALGKSVTYVHKIESGKQRIDLVEFYDLLSKMSGKPPEGLEAFLERLASE